MELVSVLFVFAVQLMFAFATVVFEGPSNTSALVGNNVLLKCSIQSQTDGTFVIWKRYNFLGQDEMITYNNVSLFSDFYMVIGYYNLFIKDIEVESEGVYECDTGDERLFVGLKVSVPMCNMTMHWGSLLPVVMGTRTNITCESKRSKPAADLRWFYGTIDITDRAHTFVKTTGPDGFGDSTSTIDVDVTSSEIPYRCVADLPGQKNVRTEFIFPPITGNGISLSYSFISTILVLLTTLMISHW